MFTEGSVGLTGCSGNPYQQAAVYSNNLATMRRSEMGKRQNSAWAPGEDAMREFRNFMEELLC
jgi:hypothetical protein